MAHDDPSKDLDDTIPHGRSSVAGDRIGPYRLLEQLGEGGMGEVWKAEQLEPVRRVVALKLIKVGMDTRQVIARFEAERQALALMDHPGIARVFDAGETERGRPYFVMEFVPGEPITEYCDRRRLNTDARLEIFRRVCEAVHHAHQKAVIHRDLKPGNVLVRDVDGRPSPKIIDFGVAKATSQKLTEKTVYTHIGQFIGTPAYMSPEQAEMTRSDVDTRSDVYSLGVLFYELLVGALPFETEDLLRAGYAEVLRILREEEPPRPSTRLSELGDRTTAIAASRDTQVRRLSHQLKGDLDWIAMKALEKDRNRRYDSAAEMARDIQRHLDHEPLLAGPPSAGYRMSKFVRRHRIGVSTAAVALIVLLAFSATILVQSQRIAQERDAAVSERQRAEAAHLYALAREEERPTRAFAYAVASLERSNQEHVQDLALRHLAETPLYFCFAKSPQGAHNPLALAVSPDGRWTAVGWSGGGGHLRVFPESGGDPLLLEGHGSWITQVEFSPDSRRLISASNDGTVRVWAIPSGEQLQQLDLETGEMIFFQQLAQSESLILYCYRSGGELDWWSWSIAGGEAEHLARWGKGLLHGDYSSVAVDSQGRWVLYGRDTELVRVLLARLGSPDGEVIARTEIPITDVYCSEDGRLALTMGADEFGTLWDLASAPIQPLRRFPVGEAPTGAAFSQDARYLAVGRWGGTTLVDLQSPVGAQPLQLRPFEGRWGFAPVFHPRHPWLLVSGTGGQVGAWPLHRSYPVNFEPGPEPLSICFSPGGDRLMVSFEGSIMLFPLSNGQSDQPRTVFEQAAHSITTMQMDAEGRFLLGAVMNSVAGNGTVHLLDLETGTRRSWQEYWFWPAAAQLHPQAHYLAVPNEPLTTEGRNRCRIIDLETDAFIDVEFEDGGRAIPWGFNPQGRLLIHHENEVYLANPATGELEIFLPEVQDGFVSPGRNWLVWIASEGGRHLTDLKSGETQLLELPSDAGRIVAVDESGRFLALSNENNALDVVDLEDRSQHRLQGHFYRSSRIRFDPSGRWLASTGDDLRVRLSPMPWDTTPEALPHDELIRLLQAQTGFHAVADEESPTRYRLRLQEFPGWDPPPTR